MTGCQIDNRGSKRWQHLFNNRFMFWQRDQQPWWEFTPQLCLEADRRHWEPRSWFLRGSQTSPWTGNGGVFMVWCCTCWWESICTGQQHPPVRCFAWLGPLLSLESCAVQRQMVYLWLIRIKAKRHHALLGNVAFSTLIFTPVLTGFTRHPENTRTCWCGEGGGGAPFGWEACLCS